jgi:hypothetical protein
MLGSNEALTRSIIGIVPNDAVLLRPVTASLVEERDDWRILERRCFSEKSLALIDATGSDELTEEDVPLATML